MESNVDLERGLSSPEPAEESSTETLTVSASHLSTSQDTLIEDEQNTRRSSTSAIHNNNARLSRLSRIADRHRHEKWYRTFLELSVPFFVAGLGMVFTGLLLEHYIKTMKSFQELGELTVLVPPLLGLKGNLEMTLAARLCTLVNLGNLNTCPKRVNATLADVALSQVQGIVVGFLAAMVSITFLSVEKGHSYECQIENIFVICAASILTASLASLFLGVVIAVVIFVCDYCNVNPDNISTQLATILGDIVSLNILAWSAEFLYVYRVELNWLAPTIVGFYVFMIAFNGYYAYKNPHTKPTLLHCWVPLILALLMSSFAGLLFEFEDTRFANVSFYEPVINGVGGNLVGVQYSRISTAYNRDGRLGKVPESTEGGPTNVCLSPCDTYFRLGKHSSTAWVLLGLGLPGHIIFAAITVAVAHDHVHVCYHFFIICYLVVCMIQISILIYSSHVLTNFLWKHKIDPDSYVIPLLTALGDVLGTIFLTIVFEVVYNGPCSSGRTSSTSSPNDTTPLM